MRYVKCRLPPLPPLPPPLLLLLLLPPLPPLLLLALLVLPLLLLVLLPPLLLVLLPPLLLLVLPLQIDLVNIWKPTVSNKRLLFRIDVMLPLMRVCWGTGQRDQARLPCGGLAQNYSPRFSPWEKNTTELYQDRLRTAILFLASK